MADQRRSSSEDRGLARRSEEQGLSRYGGQNMSSPFDLMRRFSEDVDRLFASFGFPGMGVMGSMGRPAQRTGRELSRQTGGAGATGTTAWSPSVEVFTRGEDLVVQADLPGMKPEDVDVEVEGNSLIIKGEARQQREDKDQDQGYWYSERSYGSFYRAVPLPEGVKTDNAQAQFNNGVLEVTLPGALKQLQPERRRIEVQGAKQQSGGQSGQTGEQSRGQKGQGSEAKKSEQSES